MSAPNYLGDPSYANSRLSDSLVRTTDGTPFLVHGVNSHSEAYGILLPNEEEITLPLSEVDTTPVPLGYYCTPQNTMYLFRKNHKHWKQGLVPHALAGVCTKLTIKDVGIPLIDSSLYKIIMGLYEDVDDVANFLANQVVPGVKPISRKLALKYDKGFRLLYKQLDVADLELTPGKGVTGINFNEEYAYLKEEVEADGCF